MSESLKKPEMIFICFALTASILLVFWQVRTFNFVDYDDHIYVYENPHVLGGLTAENIISAFTTAPADGNWLPLTWLSLMLDCQLFGTNPARMHMVNVFLHLVNTLLLLTVLRKMTGSLWPSAFVAAAFALHPMHVESVAWITERKDVLSTLFLLLTLAAYAGYVKRPSVFKYITSLLIFALGLMAKPMLVTLPFVLLLLDYWPLNRLDSLPAKVSGRQPRKPAPIPNGHAIWYRIWIEKIPFFALAIVSSSITFIVQRAGGAVVDITAIPLESRVANAFLSYARYIGKMFWPHNLAVFYPFDADSFSFRQIALCAMLLFGISVFVIRFGRTQKYLPVGWFWFIITLLPVIGLVQAGLQAYADRYTYIPYIGLFIMIAWGISGLSEKWPYRKVTLGITAAIALMALGMGTYRQAGYWNNSIALFTHAIEVTQNNYIAHYNLGVIYGKLGRNQEVIEAYRQAIQIKPDYAEAHNNLGNAYRKIGRHQEAIEAYRQFIRIRPENANALHGLGAAYGALGRWQEAIEAYKQSIRIRPEDANAHHGLGAAYGALGRWQEAIEAYKQSIRIKPDYAEAHYNLGIAYRKIGRWQEAIEAYRQAIGIKPDYAEAYNNLGIAYDNLGRNQEAIEAYRQAVRVKPDYAKPYNNLGNALLAEGNFREAIIYVKRSLEIEPNSIVAKNNLAWILAASPDPAVRNPSVAIRLAQEACTATNSMDPGMLDILGVAYASAGRFADAIGTARTALTLVAAAERSRIKDDIQYHLALYTQGKPYIGSAQKRPGDPNKP